MKPNVYLLVSPSVSLLKQKTTAYQQQLKFNEALINTYDWEETGLQPALEDVDTISFLTDKKMVIVEHCLFLEGKATEEDYHLEHLLNYIAHPSEDVLLILTAEKLDERKKIVKQLRKLITVEELTTDITAIIRSELKDYSLEKGVIPLLKDVIGDRTEQAFQECDKLKLYCLEDKKITCEAVKNITNKPIADKESLTFAFIRCIAEKNKKEALQLYQEMKSLDLEIYGIIGLLESQYRLLYQVLLLEKQHVSRNEMATRLEVHPFRISKTLELVRQYQYQEVKDFIKKLANLDFQIKSGQIEALMVLELLILNT